MPAGDLQRIRGHEGVNVVDSTDRMLLVDGEPNDVQALHAALPDWVLSQEQSVSAHDPRPRIRSDIEKG